MNEISDIYGTLECKKICCQKIVKIDDRYLYDELKNKNPIINEQILEYIISRNSYFADDDYSVLAIQHPNCTTRILDNVIKAGRVTYTLYLAANNPLSTNTEFKQKLLTHPNGLKSWHFDRIKERFNKEFIYKSDYDELLDKYEELEDSKWYNNYNFVFLLLAIAILIIDIFWTIFK
jgi:hypothetical protein